MPKISIAPGIYCPHPPVGSRTAPGRAVASLAREACACVSFKSVCSKQGMCPAPTSSHTIPAHQPGHRHHSSGSPHPDTLGWGQTATPRAPASTKPRHRRRPPMWSAPAFPSSAQSTQTHLSARRPARWRPAGQGAPNTLGSTPGQVVEAAPLRWSLCRSSARDSWVGH